MKLNIRLKLILGFTFLLLLSSIAQGISFLVTRQYILTQISNFQEVQAKKGATEIQGFFTQLSNEGLGIAQIYLKNNQDLAPAANYLIKSHSYIKKITILSPHGREFAKFDISGQASQDNLSYEILSEPFNSAARGEAAISKVYYIAKSLGPHLDMFVPIFSDNGDIVGVVKMLINLDQLRSILADIRLGGNGFIYVIDNEGKLIAHPSEEFVLQRPDISARKIMNIAKDKSEGVTQSPQYINEKNIPVVAKVVTIPLFNWVSVFEQPESEAFGFLTFIRNFFIVTLVGTTFFLLLVALFLSENLTRPIRKLQYSAQMIERGQLKKTVVIKSGDEIESLSTSFASLIDQLMQKKQSLEENTAQLEDANEKLKALDKLKDDFVSVASHELRTPMTAIKSYLWMVLDGQGGALNEKQRHYVQRSYNSVDRLIKLVNDMLNISRIDSGRLTVQVKSCSIEQLVREVVDDVGARAAELGITVVLDQHGSVPEVLADGDKIKEVVYNLIGNSMKFTPRGGKITASCVQKENMIEIAIKDTGAGITAENLPKLFQKFGILPDSYVTNQPALGTGLGLYICRSLVEIHGGKIWATSEGKGLGATFIFSLKVFNSEDLNKFNEKYSQQSQSKVGLVHEPIS